MGPCLIGRVAPFANPELTRELTEHSLPARSHYPLDFHIFLSLLQSQCPSVTTCIKTPKLMIQAALPLQILDDDYGKWGKFAEFAVPIH